MVEVFEPVDTVIQVVTRMVMVCGGFVYAQVDSPSPNTIWEFILNYGVLGIVVVAFFTDRLVTRSALDRVINERDKAEDARDKVIQEQFDKVIPLLETLNARLIPLMEDVNRRAKETDELLVRLSDRG